jgi:DNA-3-methyladenine glycosylase I
MKQRCKWVPENKEFYIQYHDKEWGVPVYDDRKIFEFLVLESFQAGLSWETILKKRENFRKAFDNFDYIKISNYSDKKIEELMNNSGIIRNRLKILAAVNNAKKFQEIQEEFGSFSEYMWNWVKGKPIQNSWKNISEIPVMTPLATEFAKDLKKRGFKFLGPTTVYVHMQAVGMVNDHTTDCFRY